MPTKTLALVNATGRQAASAARVASALGYRVRAHVYQASHPVANELASLHNVSIAEGSLLDSKFIASLFKGADYAFINTVSFGDEIAIGKTLADAAKKARIEHLIYSSMPDHSTYGQDWPELPLWSVKLTIENYIRQVYIDYDLVLLTTCTFDGFAVGSSSDLCLCGHLQQQFHVSSLPSFLHGIASKR